jgi:hypothetical protein
MIPSRSLDLVSPDGTVLGRLDLEQAEIFWQEGRFIPTPAFLGVAPLFREELELLERDEMEAWEAAYERIAGLGLELRSIAGEPPIRDFILHIDGQLAGVRY